MSLTIPTYRPWMNAVLYQSVWFAAVLGRDVWIIVPGLLIVLHILWSENRRTELLVMLACAVIGSLTDIALTLSGVFVFAPEPTILPIPVWLVCLWLGFATTLRHALAWFVARPPWAITAAAIGAPLSYLAAARFGAVELPLGLLRTGVLIGAAWIVLMGLFIVTTRKLSQPPRSIEPAR